MHDGPSEALIEALTSLWRVPAPGPEKLRDVAAFKWLSKTALLDYPSEHTGTISRLDFALEGALLAPGERLRIVEDSNMARPRGPLATKSASRLHSPVRVGAQIGPIETQKVEGHKRACAPTRLVTSAPKSLCPSLRSPPRHRSAPVGR